MENNKTITLRVGEKGKPLKDVENCLRVFQNDPDLKDKFRYNEREDQIYKFGALPWDDETRERPLKEIDLDQILSYFCKYNLSTNYTKNALNIVAHEHKYEPLRDYFESLEGSHDGIERAETLFIDCLGAEDTRYTREVTKLFLKACISRTFNPGCKYDYMIILVGGQGIGKSSILSKICPDTRYYTDSIPGFKKDRQFVEAIEGKLICETAELVGLNKSEIEDMKACISSQVDRTRMAYNGKTEDYPRRCVFVGTTNLDEYLRDETGNRRFLPIKCDKKRITRDIWAEDFTEYRDQIWAEAISLYRSMTSSGEALILPRDLDEVARELQEDAMEKDEWHALINAHIQRLVEKACKDKNKKDMVSIDILPINLYTEAIGGNAKDYDKRVGRRINSYFAMHPKFKKVDSMRVRDTLGREQRGRGYRLTGSVAEVRLVAEGLEGFSVIDNQTAEELDEIFVSGVNN